jgi:hypothetical protein
MKRTVCLRCDWTGVRRKGECPECGAPLYSLPESTTPSQVTSASRQQPQPSDDGILSSPVAVAQDDENGQPAVPVDGRRRAVIVGALAVVAIWGVTMWSFDRTQTSTRPGPATGSAVTDELDFPAAYFFGLPPEGMVPSKPDTGDLIGTYQSQGGWVYVYADGRVLWSFGGPTYERRLSSAGVDLVLSGAIEPRLFIRQCSACAGPPLPSGSWASSEIRQYVPSRYAMCHFAMGKSPPSRFIGLLPSAAQELLRGKQHPYRPIGMGPPLRIDCWQVTTGEARALDGILSDAGFETWDQTSSGLLTFAPSADVEVDGPWFVPVLPHGEYANPMPGAPPPEEPP